MALLLRAANKRALRLLFGLLMVAVPVVPGLAAEFDCIIEPRQVLELRSPVEGLIERVNVDRGDPVRKGQELVVLDTGVERVQAAIALQRSKMEGAVHSGESRVDFTSKKTARIEELHKQNFVSAHARDEAATEKRIAQADFRDAVDNRKLAELEHKRHLEIIRLKTIRSPINGVVTERILNPGELAESGVGRKPMLKLAEIETLHVETLLPVQAFGKVKLGMAVDVTPEIPPGSRYQGKVTVIDQVMDAASGLFGVRLELRNADRKIPAGIRCHAVFPDIDASLARNGRNPARIKK